MVLMGAGDWEAGRDGVDEWDGEISWDGRPAGYSQVSGASGEVRALADTCPGAADPGAWPG